MSTVKKATGEHRFGLGLEELAPAEPAPVRCGIELVALQDVPDAGGSYAYAHNREFPVDATISPGGVLPRQSGY